MHTLRDLQLSVMHAVLAGHAGDVDTRAGASRLSSLTAQIVVRGIAPEQRLSIYAATAQSNFIESIASSYPAIKRLVGHDYFIRCARDFHHRHPSLSGDLQPAGIHFANYLSGLHGNDKYRYLSDMARLEWLIQEALLSADHGPLDLAKLRTIDAAAYAELHFHLHPAARLFASQYPCLRIWQANVDGETEPELIDLSAGADRLLLIRSAGRLLFHRLSVGEQALLQALQTHASFAEAVGRGAADADFDASAALQRFVLAGAIVGMGAQ
ncbi:MAG: DNA-binding domain-containing protein [Pseudomonadota bacterium]|nr:DNA-binding domain-containing protein [Pseudomonadota bacterium]